MDHRPIAVASCIPARIVTEISLFREAASELCNTGSSGAEDGGAALARAQLVIRASFINVGASMCLRRGAIFVCSVCVRM